MSSIRRLELDVERDFVGDCLNNPLATFLLGGKHTTCWGSPGSLGGQILGVEEEGISLDVLGVIDALHKLREVLADLPEDQSNGRTDNDGAQARFVQQSQVANEGHWSVALENLYHLMQDAVAW